MAVALRLRLRAPRCHSLLAGWELTFTVATARLRSDEGVEVGSLVIATSAVEEELFRQVCWHREWVVCALFGIQFL